MKKLLKLSIIALMLSTSAFNAFNLSGRLMVTQAMEPASFSSLTGYISMDKTSDCGALMSLRRSFSSSFHRPIIRSSSSDQELKDHHRLVASWLNRLPHLSKQKIWPKNTATSSHSIHSMSRCIQVSSSVFLDQTERENRRLSNSLPANCARVKGE